MFIIYFVRMSTPDETWQEVLSPQENVAAAAAAAAAVETVQGEEPVLCESGESECPLVTEPPPPPVEEEWIMVFDTETTGLGPDYKTITGSWKGADDMSYHLAKGDGWEEEIENWNKSKTYIAQLSYIMYETKSNKYEIYNKFISDIPAAAFAEMTSDEKAPPADYNKLPKSEKDKYTHPITWATLKKGLEEGSEKTTMKEALEKFVTDFNRSKKAAAHNANYDRTLLFAEAARLRATDPSTSRLFDDLRTNRDKFFCTLCATKKLAHIDTKIQGSARIPFSAKFPNSVKPPALWEVYDRMFGYPPDESALHDALVDVVVCLRVFYRLWMSGIRDSKCQAANISICGRGEPDMYGKDVDGKITDYIKQITPAGIDPEGNFDPATGLSACYTEGSRYSRLPGDKVSKWDSVSGGFSMKRRGGKRKTCGGKRKSGCKKTRRNKTLKKKSRRNR